MPRNSIATECCASAQSLHGSGLPSSPRQATSATHQMTEFFQADLAGATRRSFVVLLEQPASNTASRRLGGTLRRSTTPPSSEPATQLTKRQLRCALLRNLQTHKTIVPPWDHLCLSKDVQLTLDICSANVELAQDMQSTSQTKAGGFRRSRSRRFQAKATRGKLEYGYV